MFALSTAWNVQRHTSAKEMLREIKEIGFNTVELNFTLTKQMVDEIIGCYPMLGIKVASLHNFCPIPEGIKKQEASPDYYSLSSLSEEERRKAIESTKQTIETAKELGAEVVILHVGKVEMEENDRHLAKLYKRGLKGSRDYQRIKDKMMEERRSKREPFLDRVIESLKDLSIYSSDRGIKIGIENRYYYAEIPSLEEIGIILQHLKNTSIFYWHDLGHAQNLENLGLIKHRDYLERYSTKMIGVHLHDIIGTRDHKAPLTGELDFTILREYLGNNTLKVIEVHFPATKEEIIEARTALEQIF